MFVLNQPIYIASNQPSSTALWLLMVEGLAPFTPVPFQVVEKYSQISTGTPDCNAPKSIQVT